MAQQMHWREWGDFWESSRHSSVCRRSYPSELREGMCGWPAVSGTFPPPADLVDQEEDLSAKSSHLEHTESFL